MGHQPLVDTGNLLHSALADKGHDILNSIVPEPLQQHVGSAVGHAMSPFVDRHGAHTLRARMWPSRSYVHPALSWLSSASDLQVLS